MKRINIDTVKKAYKASKLLPIQIYYYAKISIDNKSYACPLGALALYKNITNKKERYGRRIIKLKKWANRVYGKDYIEGFTDGFDHRGDISLYQNKKRYKLGYEDGQKIKKELLI